LIIAIRHTDANGMGVIEMEGIYYSTVLPPQEGYLRGLYDAWTASGNVPEPYVPPPHAPAADPAAKLAAFLAANPDVKALLGL
jgi:hypothetical protein